MEVNLPPMYKNVIVMRDPNQQKIILRSNIYSIEDADTWVAHFGKLNNTKWNFRDSQPIGQQMLGS